MSRRRSVTILEIVAVIILAAGDGGPYNWPVPLEDGRSPLLSGQLVLAIQADLSSQPLVRIPLTVLGG